MQINKALSLGLFCTFALSLLFLSIETSAYGQIQTPFEPDLASIFSNSSNTTTTMNTTPLPPLQLPPTTDPELQRINQIANNCHATIQTMHPGAQTADDVILQTPVRSSITPANYDSLKQCNLLLNQAIAQYCNTLTTYDAARCSYVNTPVITNLINMSYTIENQKTANSLFNDEMSRGVVQDAINNYLGRLQ